MVAHVASMIDLFNRSNISLLKELGFEVHIACNFEYGNVTSKERIEQFKEYLKNQEIKYYNIPFPRKISAIGLIFESYKTIGSLIKQNQYDIVHCQGPISGVIARLAVRASKNRDFKVIYTAHGFHFYKGAKLVNWLLYYNIEKMCARYTDCIITINNEDFVNAKKMVQRNRNIKIVKIPGVGIDTKKISNDLEYEKDIREEFHLHPDSRIIVTVGELVHNKNHRAAIEAFAKAKLENTYYIICGIGSEKEKLQSLVQELSLEGQVIFAGFRSDITRIDHFADLFLFPSEREGLPVSVMEAMAAGLPVVCSDVRGNRDLIDDNKGGYVRDINDIEGYAVCINKILSNKELASSMSIYNLNKIKNYDICEVNRRMKEIYQFYSNL